MVREFGDAHECETSEALMLEKTMDLHNNRIGREVGQNFGFDDIVPTICWRIKQGALKVIDPWNFHKGPEVVSPIVVPALLPSNSYCNDCSNE